MRKGAVTNVGLLRVQAEVGPFTNVSGCFGQVLQLLIGDAVVAHLQLERRNDGTKVGVATALAVTVDGSLDVARAVLYGKQGVGHGHLAVVVSVDAEG